MARAPHSGPMVPSSTSVTSGLATISPTRPVKTETSLAMWSASRPCPHASWKRTPPLPCLITTGRLPDGAGRADSFVRARWAAVRASSSTRSRSNSSKPTVAPTDSRPVCMPVSPLATHETANRVFTWSSPASTPSLLATRIRRRLSP